MNHHVPPRKNRWYLHRFLPALTACTLLIFCHHACAQQQQAEPPAIDPAGALDIETQLESFDVVWKTVLRAHWDRDLIAEKWEAARENFRPQVEAAKSVGDVRKVLNQMLDTLGQSHYGIIPFETYGIMEERKRSGGEGVSGLRLRLINEQLVVTQVQPDSPAAAAGVQAGWVLEKIDDKPVSELIEKTTKIVEHSPGRVETYVALACEAKTTGAIGDRILCRFLDDEDQEKWIEFEFAKGLGRMARFGHLPPTNVVFHSRKLPGDVGYVGFNSFLDGPGLIAQYNKSLEEFRDLNGLIIDLRGNRGGLVILVNGMCGWFVEKRISLGTMTMAGNPLQLSLNPRRPRFDKPVAVLIDECSISAAEIMSGGLKDLGVARIFGQTSAGLVLPSTVIKLPNGDGFQFALADYASASGEVLEGTGVEPHEKIELQRFDFKGNRDPVLERARQWAHEQSSSVGGETDQ